MDDVTWRSTLPELVQLAALGRSHGLLHVVHALQGLEVELDGPDGGLGRQPGARPPLSAIGSPV